MFLFGPKRRNRFSGILANFSQITAGAVLVSRMFKDEPSAFLWGVVTFLLTTTTLAVIIEPEESIKKED